MQLMYVEYQDMLNSIEKIINQKLDSFITEFTNKIQKSKKLLTKTELCSALNISRPTLDNWLKNPTLKGVLKPVFEKRGARYFFDEDEFKKVIAENSKVFSNGKDYNYKWTSETPNWKKDVRRYNELNSVIYNNRLLNEEEKKFYNEFCESSGNRNLLKT
ncbi:MAG: helix-turn-helix domain-containing protein [Bacteroidetes bacterium]|nr:helix-turn-helix domain-containing protein [Bacteroidota bacterium]MBS1671194.1 helix-turn-helix domain-containing protein [Bacteroidota bacterium]